MSPIFSWLEPSSGMDASVLERIFEGWETHVLRDLGGLLKKGCEVHCVVNPVFQCRAFRRNEVRAFVAPLLAETGYLATRILHDKPCDFVLRVGFKKTWSDQRFDYFMLTQLPFERAAR